MTPEQEILSELKKINEQLVKNNKSNVILNNFLAGFFHSFGNFLGFIVLSFVLLFFASRYNWTQALSHSFESIMSQIDWSKIVPAPKVQFTSPFSQP